MFASRSWMASSASCRMNASIFFTVVLPSYEAVAGLVAEAAPAGAGAGADRSVLRLGAGHVDEALGVAEHPVLRDVEAAQLVAPR